MSADSQLYRIDPEKQESKALEEVELADLGFQERRDLQEWVANNPDILGEDLLLVGKEFSGFDRTNERLDLLAVDGEGKLVVIELKRDDSGVDVHWQAIKYASYLRSLDDVEILGMFGKYARLSNEQARQRMLEHLNADGFSALNNDQRIILASHRFAPEVTSAALWLNEKTPGGKLITCIQLTPYQDAESGALYVQSNTIIPVPGADQYMIGVGAISEEAGRSTFADKMLATKEANKNDEITAFLRRVAALTLVKLSEDNRPDRRSQWAGDGGGPLYDRRHFHLWYKYYPWGNWDLSYFVNLYNRENSTDDLRASVGLMYWNSDLEGLEEEIATLRVFEDQAIEDMELRVWRVGKALDDEFADDLAATMGEFIDKTKRKIDAFADRENEEGT